MGLRERGEHLEAAQHLRQRVAARHLGEALALKRVDRHVEAGDAGRHERGRLPLEQVAVGRQRDLAELRDRCEQLDERRQLAAHERLAAGQAHVAHAHLAEHPDNALDLLERQQLAARQPLDPLGGHAVAASEPAPVGHGDPDVADRATVPVDQLRAFCHAATIPG